MERSEAARLLGIAADATPREVRRAFRLWAAMAHPDHGGSERQFALLCQARSVLLRPPPPPEITTPPRKAWRDVVVRPGPRGVALLMGLVALSIVAVLAAPLGPMPWSLVGAALASTVTCMVAGRLLLNQPDHGHVIVTRSLAWIAVTALQCALAAAVGIPAFEALPLLAVPFVACISLVNPGAGLWRPSRSAWSVNVR